MAAAKPGSSYKYSNITDRNDTPTARVSGSADTMDLLPTPADIDRTGNSNCRPSNRNICNFYSITDTIEKCI